MRLRSPPSFFVAGLLAAVALWLGLLVGEIGMPTRGSLWMHQLFTAKHDAVARVDGPKLVVTGGSGVLYSVRARDLSRELGIPVVNGGLHAGLGRQYILHEVRKLVRPGDTLVLALEYELYVSDEHDATLLDYLVSYDPGYLFRMDGRERLHDVLALPFARLANPYLGKVFGGFTPWPFYLTAEGDVLGNNSVMKLDYMRQNLAVGFPDIGAPTPAARDDLRAFAEWARANGVRVLTIHPVSVFRDAYLEDPRYAQAFEKLAALHQSLGIPYLDGWMDSLMHSGLFFDTVYHTTELGSAIRTRHLARLLRPYVQGRCWGAMPPSQRADGSYEKLDQRFHRFEPVRGFGPMHGPEPPGPLFIESLSPRSEALVRTLAPSSGHLVARLRGTRPGQRVEVRVDGSAVATWALDPAEDRRFEAEVALHAGANRLELLHGAGAAAPIRITEWRVDVPDDARNGAPLGPQPPSCSSSAATAPTAASGETPIVPNRTSGSSGGS